jgi:epoxide hydrolase
MPFPNTDHIEAYKIAIAEEVLEDLRSRLANTRWPDRETVNDWSQGAPLERVKSLCNYWRQSYNWRKCEARLNSLGQSRTVIDGVGIHFLHMKSPNSSAVPLILTHGWPGSVIEFLDVIGPLTNPGEYGGSAADSFHVVVPSLPGFGFSDKPVGTGWGVTRIATAWVSLMRRLGYEKFFAQGGDWGAVVTTQIGAQRPAECLGIHLNMPVVFPNDQDLLNPTEAERASIASLGNYRRHDSAYASQQSTRPQTLGYALCDSPAGQAAWIYEKLFAWTDNSGDPETAVSRDAMLDNIMLYWLGANATSSARLYWESPADSLRWPVLQIPVGVSIFPKEILRPSRRWAERCFANIVYWNELGKGGHFAALEQPQLFVNELRTCFRGLR